MCTTLKVNFHVEFSVSYEGVAIGCTFGVP